MISWSPERLPARGGIHSEGAALSWVLDDLGRRQGQGLLQPAGAPDPETLKALELEEAYRRGRSEGERAAQGRARREVETALAAARSVVREAREAQAGWSRALEENLAALATAVAARLVQNEVVRDPGVLGALVHQALATFPPEQEIKVRLNPADLASLAPEAGPGVRWVADDAVARGGCLLEGPDRIVDGRLDEGLKRIYKALVHG